MREIVLTKGKVALVDDKDYDYLNQWKWSYHPAGYAKRTIDTCKSNIRRTTATVFMHRQICSLSNLDAQIDHINGDGLDNRRSNLRVCTHAQNAMNKRKALNKTSNYKGVYFCKTHKRFIAQIKLNGKSTHVGIYRTEKEAAKAYNDAALKHFKEFAKINDLQEEALSQL